MKTIQVDPNNHHSAYIVYCKGSILEITDNVLKAESLVEISREKGHKAYIKQINGTRERLDTLIANITERAKNLNNTNKKDIIPYRNMIVNKFLELKDSYNIDDKKAWNKVKIEANLPGINSMEEFNQFTLDIVDYITTPAAKENGIKLETKAAKK